MEIGVIFNGGDGGDTRACISCDSEVSSFRSYAAKVMAGSFEPVSDLIESLLNSAESGK